MKGITVTRHDADRQADNKVPNFAPNLEGTRCHALASQALWMVYGSDCWLPAFPRSCSCCSPGHCELGAAHIRDGVWHGPQAEAPKVLVVCAREGMVVQPQPQRLRLVHLAVEGLRAHPRLSFAVSQPKLSTLLHTVDFGFALGPK